MLFDFYVLFHPSILIIIYPFIHIPRPTADWLELGMSKSISSLLIELIVKSANCQFSFEPQ